MKMTVRIFLPSLVDSIMNQQVGEKVGEIEVDQKIWDAYKEFLNFLNIEKLEVLRAIKLNKEIKGYIVKKVYERAIADAKTKTGYKLTNLWDYFKKKEFGGNFPYVSPDMDNPIDIKKNNSNYYIFTFIKLFGRNRLP